MSVESHILDLLKHFGDDGWMFAGVIADIVRERTGAKASNVERRLRELAAGRRGSKDRIIQFLPKIEVRYLKIERTPNRVVQYRIREHGLPEPLEKVKVEKVQARLAIQPDWIILDKH